MTPSPDRPDPIPNPLVDSLHVAADNAGGVDELAADVYTYLFLTAPEARAMFPSALANQRDKFVRALARMVANAWDPEVGEVRLSGDEVDRLERLAVDHLKFGAVPAHYDAVGASLLWVLRWRLGEAWPAVADLWAVAYKALKDVMVAAAGRWLEAGNPPYVDGVIRAVTAYHGNGDRARTIGAVELDVHGLSHPYPVPAGESVTVCLHARPGDWTRALVVAHLTRPDGLRLRVVPGRMLASISLTQAARPGDLLRLEPPNPTSSVEDHES